MERLTFAAEAEDIGSRIDVFLAANLDTLSRSAIQKLIKEGNILCDGKNLKSNYKLRKGDVLTVEIPEAAPLEIEAENIPLDIVYEDDQLVVVYKPRGMVVHPAPGHYTGTLVNALMYHCKDSLSGINGVMRPGIVHRIDKDTSGLLMVAKTDVAHVSLAKQLAEHSITRKYNALVFHGFQEEEGTVDVPIGRHPDDRKKMSVITKTPRRAVTHYKVLEAIGKFTLIEAQLETGRTHQIRVHMTHIGHPLVGDLVYGPKKQPFHAEGQALHAGVLGFVHPTTGEYMEFSYPRPDWFEALLDKARNRQSE